MGENPILKKMMFFSDAKITKRVRGIRNKRVKEFLNGI